MLFLIDIPLLGLTFTDLVAWIVAIFVGVAGLIKAISEIVTIGFVPAIKNFKSWLVRWGTRRKQLEEIKTLVVSIDDKVDRIRSRVRHQDETSDKALFELNERGSLTFANCSFCDLVNADEKELTHRDYISRMENGDKTRFLGCMKEAIDNLMPLDTAVRFRLNKVEIVTVRLTARPDIRPNGEIKGFFGTAVKVEA